MAGNTDPDGWNDWIQLLAALGAGGLAVYRYGRRCLDFFHRLGRSVALSDRWHAEHGSDPAYAVSAILRAAGQDQRIAEIERHLLAERLSLGLYICEPSGACTAASDHLCEMFETDSRDMLGSGWLINVVDREQVYERWLRAVRLGLPYDANYEVRLSNGVRKAHTRAYAITTEQRVVVCYVGYVEWTDEPQVRRKSVAK